MIIITYIYIYKTEEKRVGRYFKYLSVISFFVIKRYSIILFLVYYVWCTLKKNPKQKWTRNSSTLKLSTDSDRNKKSPKQLPSQIINIYILIDRTRGKRSIRIVSNRFIRICTKCFRAHSDSMRIYGKKKKKRY